MYGTVFYDWNGNGTQDWVEGQGEPPLPGLRICLDDLDSGLCAVSAETGQYLIDEVPPGEHNLLVDADPYSFLFVSVDAAAALGMEDVPVAVDGPTVVNIGLGDGPLTLPFLCGETGQLAGVSNYFDRDPRPGPVRDWMGGSRSTDGYTATTFDVQGQITVVASAPGVVNYVGPNADRYVVEVLCDDAVPWFPAGRSLWLYYYGLDEVSVERGDRVARGQTLGSYTEYGLETGSDLQRFSIRPKYTDGYGSYIFVDLFRDTQAAESRGLWTRDNDPACFPGP
jgi:murein DD-endopeptidase MepM/ murein hydrolase activator NlpD